MKVSQFPPSLLKDRVLIVYEIHRCGDYTDYLKFSDCSTSLHIVFWFVFFNYNDKSFTKIYILIRPEGLLIEILTMENLVQ